MGIRPLVIIGGGAHSREIIGFVADINSVERTFSLLGVLADEHWDAALLLSLGVPRIGAVADLAEIEAEYVIAIGDGEARLRLDRFATGIGRHAASLVHPSATIGSRISYGPGFVAFPGVRVTTEVTIGRHVHLNLNATISHDCVLEDYVTLAPGATLAGRVIAGSGASFGVNASVLPGVTIGRNSIVGAGAVVLTDVEANARVAGVPARRLTRVLPEASPGS